MKNDDRRKALGTMLMDIAKYLATVGLIGSFLTGGLTVTGGAIIAVVVVVLMVVAFYVIPQKGGLP